MSIISILKQGLNATEQLATLPFQLTREFVSDRDRASGRFLKQISHISQTAVTMPLKVAKNLLDDPEGNREYRSQDKKERLHYWTDDDTDKFEELGRS